MSAVKCKHAPNGGCNASTNCQPIVSGFECPRLENNAMLRFFNPAREIAILWSVDDVDDARPDLTDEQKMSVLEEVSDHHDASWGVTWDTLKDTADILFPADSPTGFCGQCGEITDHVVNDEHCCPDCEKELLAQEA